MEDVDELIALARELPADVPDAAHREEVRTALLARAQIHRAPARRRWSLIALPLAAAAAGALYLARPAPPLHAMVLPVLEFPHRGHVRPLAGATYDLHSAVPDERVALHDGTIEVDVDHLHPTERFRVVVGTSEVEVRGTAFSVTADHDRLIEVRVTRGRVEVRPTDHPQITLGAGDRWSAVAVVPSPPPPEPPPRIVRRPQLPPPPPARMPTADQQAYDDGWTALRAQRFDDAAAAFARSASSTGALADDARYWHAVSLARAHHDAIAITAFREAIDEHPGSSHAGEASAMLGWLLVDAKDLVEARARFAAAADDANDRVRSSARAGLDALARAGH